MQIFRSGDILALLSPSPKESYFPAADLLKADLHHLLLCFLISNTRHGVIRFALQQPAILLLVHAAPLLEKEGHVVMGTIIFYVKRPVFIHGVRSGTGFTADNDPIHMVQIQVGIHYPLPTTHYPLTTSH